MSCFCQANLNLLPSLDADASLNLSASAQAAFDLYAQISLGLPDLGLPPFALPQLNLSAGALASLAAMAQLRAQASANLGIDLTTNAGVTALARLTATLATRMEAIMSLDIRMDAWVQLARLNAVSLDLTAMLNACQDALEDADAAASETFGAVMAPPSWGGAALPSLSAMAASSAQLDASLDAEFVASLQAAAAALARATANVSLDASAAASFLSRVSAVAQLSAGLGVNPLQAGLPAVRAMVASNFSRMAAAAARCGIDLSLGPAGLPALPAIPGLSAALTAGLTARLQAAASAAASLNSSFGASVDTSLDLSASFDMDLSLSVLLAVSLSINLSLALGIDVALPAPCGTCDLRSIMAALSDPPIPSLDAPETPSVPSGATPPAPAAPAATPAASPDAPADAPTSAAGGSSGGSGGGGGGGGGGAGGGGVPATVMSAQLMCTFGMAPSALSVLPVNRTTVGGQVAANIMDHVPLVNIMPFGMCITPSNPMVAAATAAALGVLTPMPCIPATASPWAPGAPTVMLGNMPMLDSTSKCMCNWGGVISVVVPGQFQTTIP